MFAWPGFFLLGAIAYGGCCIAVVRAFFLPRPDGVALPSAIWWLVGVVVLSAGSVVLGSTNAVLVHAALIVAVLVVGQALCSLWWRGRAMQAEIEKLRATLDGMPAVDKIPPVERDSFLLYDLNLACAKTARAYDLTRREEDVLRLLVEGCSANEVAERLVLSQNTVKSHVRRIYRKMGVSGKSGVRARMEEACRI